MKEQGLVLDKLYSVMLHDYYDSYHSSIDCFKVLGSAHFNGVLIADLRKKLIFNLEDNKGSVIIPLENIKWMVPVIEEKKERAWLDDL